MGKLGIYLPLIITSFLIVYSSGNSLAENNISILN